MNTNYQSGKAWSIVAMLMLLQFVNFLDKIAIGLVAVPMMTELKLTPVQFGLIGSSFFWLFAVSGIVFGFVANRVPTRWLLLGMAAIWSIVQLPLVVSGSLTVIVLARVVLGVGEGPLAPVANHAVYKWFPDHKRNLPIIVMNAGATIGLLVAGLGIPAITAHWGWRANFWILAAVGALWVVLWSLFGREGQGGEKPATGVNPGVTTRRIPYSRLIKDRTIIGILLLHFAAYWGLALTLTWLPAYLQKGLGYNAATAGRLFAVVVLISVPISLGLAAASQRLLARGISSRVSRGWLSAGALVFSGVLFLLLLLDLSSGAKVALVAIASGLTPIVYSLGPAMNSEVSPVSQRGAMLAIENSIAALAGMLAPLVSGRLIETSANAVSRGYEYGFAVGGVLLVALGLIGWVMVDPERSRRALAQQSDALESPGARHPSFGR